MENALSLDIQRAIERAVNQKWEDHMNKERPKLIYGLIGSYIAGLGSGIWLQKYLIGPK
jgi:hypothetical protein